MNKYVRVFCLPIVIGFFIGVIGVPFLYSDVFTETEYEQAVFAGGCFWCMESDFEKIKGVKEVISGYAGGSGENPTYQDYSRKGHIEVIKVVYDPALVGYEKLLKTFWRKVDPTDSGGQFCDRGYSYTTAIFYEDERQKQLIERSKSSLEKSGQLQKPIVTQVLKASQFYPAEEYHQDYYKKNPVRYKFYRLNCGRDKRLKKLWGNKMKENQFSGKSKNFLKPSQEELKKQLTPLQYKVTQQDGTERPFKNEYWDNKKEGIYVDIVSGEPLFSSTDKYKSGTGWPSFIRPLVSENIVEKEDRKLFGVRTEVRSKQGDSHLGHVFNDGPQPTGLRYCINSAALRFIPQEELTQEGYEEYNKYFK